MQFIVVFVNIENPVESQSEDTESSRSIFGNLASILGGGLGIYSFTVPFVRVNLDTSVEFLGQTIPTSSDSTSLTFGEFIGFISNSHPVDGIIMMCLAVGGAILAITGGVTNRVLTVLGGTMMIAGSVLTQLSTSSGEFSAFGGFVDVEVSTEPAFGIILLGVAGLITVFSVRV